MWTKKITNIFVKTILLSNFSNIIKYIIQREKPFLIVMASGAMISTCPTLDPTLNYVFWYVGGIKLPRLLEWIHIFVL